MLTLPVAAGEIPTPVPPSANGDTKQLPGDMSAGAAGDISFAGGGEIPNPVTEAVLALLQGMGLLP
jgi:hypothetical protein